MSGHCVNWNPRRQFGKVRGDDGVEYFVHADELIDRLTLTYGERVEFTPTDAPRGPRALDVRVVETPARAERRH